MLSNLLVNLADSSTQEPYFTEAISHRNKEVISSSLSFVCGSTRVGAYIEGNIGHKMVVTQPC
jgi:hypothetical protein